jgi:hypothetical protein
MTVQFWLWGLDAMHQDLQRRGFEKLARPDGSECSVYRFETANATLHIHGFGLWLESSEGILVYRRPAKTWYALPCGSKLEFNQFTKRGLEWCSSARPKSLPPKRALQQIRPVVLEHERWIAHHRGEAVRTVQLARVSHRAVRRAKNAWIEWLEGAA